MEVNNIFKWLSCNEFIEAISNYKWVKLFFKSSRLYPRETIDRSSILLWDRESFSKDNEEKLMNIYLWWDKHLFKLWLSDRSNSSYLIRLQDWFIYKWLNNTL